MERAAWRIVDANLNRAREAARVVEDFCRFSLNCGRLAARAKQLRHDLCAAVGVLDQGRLIAGRDTAGDVGTGITVDGQLSRRGLGDCLTAACKRLGEALRVLAEVIQAEDASVARRIEQLRYASYSLEKDIVVFAEPAAKFEQVGLYVLISSGLPAEILTLAHKCAAGGADCIQLRAKDIADDKYAAIASEFVRICRDAGVVSVINDRVDIAVASGADGVHLGQRDLPVEHARGLELRPLVIGKSTHCREELRLALEEMPTYVSLGPVFETSTKPGVPPVGLSYVRQATGELGKTGIAHVAVGGITGGNVGRVLRAGAKAVAVCSAVTGARDARAACRALKAKIAAFQAE
ncbi:MAG: thiamine phosphate synthase [Phycisphaerales bacterium]|nr:MAG: thiamine phosphate synthase [Phycisphaerales bacterium]